MSFENGYIKKDPYALNNNYGSYDHYAFANNYLNKDPYQSGSAYGGVGIFETYRNRANSYGVKTGAVAGAYYRSYQAMHPAKKAELAEAGAGLGMVGGLIGGLQAKAATITLGKTIAGLAGVSAAGSVGLVGLAGVIGISALAGSVALKAAPTLTKAGIDIAEDLTKVSAKTATLLGKKALLPAAKKSVVLTKNLKNLAMNKLQEKLSIGNKQSEDKFRKLLGKSQERFAKGEDVLNDINQLYKTHIPNQKLEKELQNLNTDNHLRNSISNDKIDINRAKESVKQQAKELGWDNKRVKNELSALDKRLEFHKKELNITKDNRVLSIAEKEHNIFLKKSLTGVKQNFDIERFDEKAKNISEKEQKFAGYLAQVKKEFIDGKDVKEQINTLYKLKIPNQKLEKELQNLNADNHLKRVADKNGKIDLDKAYKNIEKQGNELNWTKDRIQNEKAALNMRLEYHKENLDVTQDNVFVKILNKENKDLSAKKAEEMVKKDKNLSNGNKSAFEVNKNIGSRKASSLFESIVNSGKFEKDVEYFEKAFKEAHENDRSNKTALNGYRNALLLKNDGLNVNDLQKWQEKIMQNDSTDGRKAKNFANGLINHAKKLEHAGILKQDKEGNFKFSDEKSKEILFFNRGRSVRELKAINEKTEQFKELQKEREMPGKQLEKTKELQR